MKTEAEKKAILEGLNQHTGTDGYHRNMFGLLYTDGIAEMAQGLSAFWLIDAVESHQRKALRNPCLREFQLWKLKVEDGKATLTCKEDSGQGQRLKIIQRIPYTDFPEPGIEFYVINGVMLLKSEY